MAAEVRRIFSPLHITPKNYSKVQTFVELKTGNVNNFFASDTKI